MSIITTGINIVATGVSNSINQIQRFGRELKNSERLAQSWANGYNKASNDVVKRSSTLSSALNANWRGMYDEARKSTRKQEAELRKLSSLYDRTFREIGNKYQSMVMGSVALSMSGIGLKNMGMSVLDGAKASLDVARDFETVMAQIQFYGKKTADEMSQIQKDVFDIAYKMPQTASEIGKAFLQAQKTGYNYDASTVMAEEASKISFMSMGKLDGEEALKYISQMKKLTNAYATEGERLALVQKGITDSLSVTQLTDRLTMTADVSAASIDSLWKTMQSSRSAFDNMGTDIESMLAISAVMSDRLQPRAAGQALSSFGRGINMAEKAKAEGRGTRGEYYSQLTNAMGGGVDSFKGANGSVDVLRYIEGVATKSMELWGDGVDRTSKLISIFGNSAIDLFHAYDNYAMSGNMNMEEMRDKIRDAEGHSTSFMEAIMNTSYGTEMKLKAVAEQFQILYGTAIRPMFNDLLDGLTFVIGKINQFIQQHPKLVKVLGYGVGLAGMLLVASGAIMLVIGGILALYSSIGNVITQIARNTKALNMLAMGYSTAGEMLKGKLLTPLKLLGGQLLKTSAITFFLWMAWKNDFLRMRTTFTEWRDYIKKGLSDSKKLFELYGNSSVSEWNAAWKRSERDGTLDNWVARNLTKAKILWDGLREMFMKRTLSDGSITDGILTDDTHAKLAAMGLLGFVESIYEAKVAMVDFWNGFQDGMKDGLELVKTLLQPLLTIWDWLSEKILAIFQHFGYFENVNKGVGSEWEQWGTKLGYIVGSVIAIRVAIWGWVKAFKLLLSPFRLFGRTAEKMLRTFDLMKKLKLDKLAKGLGRVLMGKSLMNMLGAGRYATQRRFSGSARQGAHSRLPYARRIIDPTTGKPTGQVRYMRHRDNKGPTYIPSKNGKTSGTLQSRGVRGRMTDMWLGRAYAPDQRTDKRGRTYNEVNTGSGRTRTTADGKVKGKNLRTGGLKGGLSRLAAPLRNERGAIGRTRGVGGARGGGGIGKGIANLFKGVGKGVGKLAPVIGKGLLKGLGKVLIKGIPFIFKLGLRAIPFLGWALLAWDAISLIWSNWDWIKKAGGIAWDWIKEKASDVWDWTKLKASEIWNGIVGLAQGAWAWIAGIASSVWQSILGFGSSVWSGITGIASGVWNSITGFASTMWNGMTSFVTTAWDGVTTVASNAIDSVTGFVNNIFSGLYDSAVEAWEKTKEFITNNPITQGVKTTTDNVKTKVNSAIDKVKNFFGVSNSARTGEWYVPKDNMPYNLHQGEMVLKRREAQILRSMVGSDNNSISKFLLDRDDVSASTIQVTPPQKRIIKPKIQGTDPSNPTPQGNGDTTIQVSFEEGAIQVANASPSEMKKGAKLMFEEFKRMVELENMKHYKPARPRTR